MRRLLSSLLYVFFLLIICFSSLPSSSLSSPSGPQCHPDEISALLQFKSSFSKRHPYTSEFPCFTIKKTTDWNKTSNCCTWTGITCDRITGHVIGLDLSFGCLQGTISSNSSLFLLRHLQTLYLSGNDFRGSPILAEFGQFKNMTDLNLSDSNFSGHVPMEISHLSKLVSLGLGGSSFDGGNKVKIEAANFKALSRNLTYPLKLERFYTDRI